MIESTWANTGVIGSQRQGPQTPGDPLAPIPLNNDWEPCPEDTIGSLRQGAKGNLTGDLTRGRGAGRSFDMTFPVPALTTSVESIGISAITRYGTQSAPFTGSQGGTGSSIAVIRKGRTAFKLDGGTGFVEIATDLGRADLAPNLGGAKEKSDFACWRMKAIMSFDALGDGTPGHGSDLGLEVVLDGDSSSVLLGFARGFTLRPTNDGRVILYIARTAGVFTVSDVCDITIDPTEFNCYEFRLLGATDTKNAQFKALINGQQQFLFDFDGVTMPSGETFSTHIIARTGSGQAYLAVGGGSISAAPTEDALL